MPDTEPGYIQRTETATGLRPERFLNEFTTAVTAEDFAQAPPSTGRDCRQPPIPAS